MAAAVQVITVHQEQQPLVAPHKLLTQQPIAAAAAHMEKLVDLAL
jgi:hypothetical protein